MIPSHLYSVRPQRLAERYDTIVAECRRQGIGEITILASVTGKLTASPEELRDLKRRLQADGLGTSAMIFAVGHPRMEDFYEADGTLKRETWYDGGLVVEAPNADLSLLPREWQYAVNEFGQSVYCSACPNATWREGNLEVIRALAGVFDEVWYDDEYRIDSDQFAGVPLRSTASCYCDACLESLGKRLGKRVTREEVTADPRLHEAWVAQKVEQLSSAWSVFCRAGREVNPRLAVGLMVRWGGEERDGLDVPALAAEMGARPLLRLGEGHFRAEQYVLPASQVIEYLASTYHLSWFPRQAVVKSETTYFAPMPREGIVKKAALALAAGAGQLSYCPCVPEWVTYQKFIGEDRRDLERWGDAIADKAAMWGEIQIVRGKAAAAGDCRPAQRQRDRQAFPLFGMAGLCSGVVRIASWRQDRTARLAAVTGRAIWDYPPADWAGHKCVMLDGAALLEDSPANAALGIARARQEAGGRVVFEIAADASGGGWARDGLLWRKDGVLIVPVVWQDIPEAEMEPWLREIRRAVGPLASGAVVEGDVYVLPVHYRHADRDVIMVVNLTKEPRKVRLGLPLGRTRLADLDGRQIGPDWDLAPDEIRVAQAV